MLSGGCPFPPPSPRFLCKVSKRKLCPGPWRPWLHREGGQTERRPRPLTWSLGPRFCKTSLPVALRISTPVGAGDAGVGSRLSSRPWPRRGESPSSPGLLPAPRPLPWLLRGVFAPRCPTLRASKSSVLLSKAPSTLQNMPPYFCRGTWSVVPGRARYTGRSSSWELSQPLRPEAMVPARPEPSGFSSPRRKGQPPAACAEPQ